MAVPVQRQLRSDYTRLFLLPNKAGPGHVPVYEGLWKAGAPKAGFGTVTRVWLPNSDQYGQFTSTGVIIGEPAIPTLPIMARFPADQRSTLLELGKAGCPNDVQIHIGLCQDPQDFNHGWDKIVVLSDAHITDWTTTDIGAMQPSERSMVMETANLSAQDLFEIVRMVLAQKAAEQVVQEVVGITVCDRIQCGECGVVSNGCDKVFAVTKSHGGSPGLSAEVIYSDDGGLTWGQTNITTLAPTEDPTGVACVGSNLVVISAESESLHYAPLADILAGTETWTEVTTGFVAGHGPTAIVAPTPTAVYIVGLGGYIYFTTDPTAGVDVQDAGVATVQDYADVHAYDALNALAVGAANAAVFTANGGLTWAALTGPDVGVDLTCCWQRSTSEWFVGSNDGKLWYTLDSGASWTERTFPGSGAGKTWDIVFVNSTVGYLAHATAAPAGRILRTIDGGNSWYVAPEGTTTIPANDHITALGTCQDVNAVFAGGLADDATDGIIVIGAGA